jgi:hypothetical protein
MTQFILAHRDTIDDAIHACAQRHNCAVSNVRDALDRHMVEKVTAPIEMSVSINNARKEAARIYASYFAGAPVNGEIEMVERRLLEVLTYLYRKRG